MYAKLLHPAAQKNAFSRTSPPSAAELFYHQSEVLRRYGLSTPAELAVAEKHTPPKPFVFIPASAGRLGMNDMMRLVGITFGESFGRNRCGPIINAKIPSFCGAYFLTDYMDFFGQHGENSAEERAAFFIRNARIPVNMTEISFRLMYFAEDLNEMQFAAAGSSCSVGRGVPTISVPKDGGSVPVLDSFAWEHKSSCTHFPSCRERVMVPPD